MRLTWYVHALLLWALLASAPVRAEIDSGVLQELSGPPGGHFGAAVAVSGNYALVGQPAGVVHGMVMGRVLVYEYQDGLWVQVAEWTPVGEALQQARFGVAVALEGTSAFVGADGEYEERGAVYLFERRQGVWQQREKYTPSNARPQTYFGRTLAVSNNRALAGAPGAGADQTQAGVVYAIPSREGVWSLAKSRPLVASDGRALDGFGASLAMSGSLALVGAPGHDGTGTGQPERGAVYIFELDRGLWRESARLQASDGQAGDLFGSALALSGSEAVVGARGYAGQGAAYVFQLQTPGGSSIEVQKLFASDGARADHFGAALALSGEQLCIGAYGRTVQQQPLAGSVYVYTRQGSGSAWSAVGSITAPQPVAQAHFGYALALAETHVLLGAPGWFGSPGGRVYTYGLSASNTEPVITSLPITTALVGSAYVYDVEATDTDGDTLTYGLASGPGGMLIAPTTGHLTWTPSVPGQVTVQVEVQDGHGGKATQTYQLLVSLANQAPQITSTPETSATLQPLFPLVSVRDTHLAGYSVMLNGQPYVPGTPLSAAGDYVLTVTASDAAGNTSVRTVHFTLRRSAVP
ncbi:MAG: putative Ig domain-containing protein [Candidatus Tectimicrobiota bacterium]